MATTKYFPVPKICGNPDMEKTSKVKLRPIFMCSVSTLNLKVVDVIFNIAMIKGVTFFRCAGKIKWNSNL